MNEITDTYTKYHSFDALPGEIHEQIEWLKAHTSDITQLYPDLTEPFKHQRDLFKQMKKEVICYQDVLEQQYQIEYDNNPSIGPLNDEVY